ACAVFFQAFHHNPIQVATDETRQFPGLSLTMLRDLGQLARQHRAQAGRGTRWLRLTYGTAHRVQALLEKFFGIEWGLASKQFVKQDAQAVNVAARIDAQFAKLSLFRAHVGWRTQELLEGSE